MDTPTRTPEGWPNRCPVCGHNVRIDPSWPTLDAPCPRCGHLLWFSSKPAACGAAKATHLPMFVFVSKRIVSFLIFVGIAFALIIVGSWLMAWLGPQFLIVAVLGILLLGPKLGRWMGYFIASNRDNQD
jgi:hypothetical protein